LTSSVSSAKRKLQTRRAYLKHRGVIDPPDEQPSGPCEVCGTPASPLHLDHDHKTGLVRGWLCQSCNRGIGLMGDSAERLLAAARYLKERNLVVCHDYRDMLCG
jgi:hypothetical protein